MDLAAEVRSLFDYFEAWAEERGVALALEGIAPAVPGDRPMLRRALRLTQCGSIGNRAAIACSS